MQKRYLFFIMFIILFIAVSPIFAESSDNSTLNQNLEDNSCCINQDNNDFNSMEELNDKNSVKEDTPILNADGNSSRTIEVDGSSVNQMDDPTIQNAIDGANPGDTILITGKNYEHAHIVIDKQLNIISNVNTKISICPSHTTGSGSIGAFYINENASGTVISGFTLINDYPNSESYSVPPYAIYSNGASNLTFENLTITSSSTGYGLSIHNGNNISVNNSKISKGLIGIYINNNSSGILINNSNISSNKLYGMDFESADNVNITNNYIMYNRDGRNLATSTKGVGIYFNSNVSNVNIISNLFTENGEYGIFNSYKVRNLMVNNGYDQVIDFNFFISNGAVSSSRFAYTSRYIPYNNGDYIYNENNDTYTYVGMGKGNYTTSSNTIYAGHNLILNDNVCGATLSLGMDHYDSNQELAMSEVKQLSPGIYEVYFYIKSTGEVADKLNIYNITFYLNKNNTNAVPQKGDIYRTVAIKNGVAIANFTNETYYKTNNDLIVLGPGISKTTKSSASRIISTFNIPDGDVLNIKKAVMDTDLNKNNNIIVTLKDSDDNIITNDNLTYFINGNPSNRTLTTDNNGQVIIDNLSGKLNLTIVYIGNRYDASNESFLVFIKTKNSTTIVYENMTQNSVDFYNGERGRFFEVTLKDVNGNVLSDKPVSIGFNGVVYPETTDANGVARLKINLQYPGVYTFAISFLSDDEYYGSFAVSKITITKKISKLIVSDKKYKSSNRNKVITVKLLTTNVKTGLIDYPANKKTVTITVNGKTYKATTNSKGIANIKVSINKRGTYIVTTKFTGNAMIKYSSTKSKLVIF